MESNWQEEFDKKFIRFDTNISINGKEIIPYSNIKSFISTLIQEAEERGYENGVRIEREFLTREVKEQTAKEIYSQLKDNKMPMDVIVAVKDQALHSYKEELVEKIEGMKFSIPTQEKLELTMDSLKIAEEAIKFHAHNQALQDIINLIKQ